MVAVEVTIIPAATAEVANVPVPTNVTTSGEITPANCPVITAARFPS